MNLFYALVLGSLFGFTLYKIGAAHPHKMQQLLTLQDFTLLKTILFGIGFASILLSLSSLLGFFDLSNLSIKSMNLGVILGGILFGIGFGAIGTCPGTCVAAMGGSNKTRAFVAIIGGLFGALAYSLAYEFIVSTGIFFILDYGKLTLFSLSEAYPSLFSTGFIGLLFMGIVFVIASIFIPTTFSKTTQV